MQVNRAARTLQAPRTVFPHLRPVGLGDEPGAELGAIALRFDVIDVGVRRHHEGEAGIRGADAVVVLLSVAGREILLVHGGTLPLPHSRPELFFGPDGTAHILFRSRELDGRLALLSLAPPDYDRQKARLRVLVDEDLGHYEPVIDRARWRAGRGLAAYVQPCEQLAGGDEGRNRSTAEARFMAWSAERFA